MKWKEYVLDTPTIKNWELEFNLNFLEFDT